MFNTKYMSELLREGSLIQVSLKSISFHSGYIAFQWAKDNRGCQEERSRWLSKFPDQCTHPVVFLSGKQGSSLEYKHMLLKLVGLVWLGILVELHSGNLLTMTKQTSFKKTTPLRGLGNKHMQKAKVHSTATMACTCLTSSEPWFYWIRARFLICLVFIGNHEILNKLVTSLYFYYPWRRLMFKTKTMGF